MPTLASASPMPRRRVGVVVQRFGEGLAGGAEWHAGSLIDALAPHHDITVLTSCARDATTWAMHYPPGDSTERGVRVRRFAHPVRNLGGRAKVPLRHKLRFLTAGLLDFLRITRVPKPRGCDAWDGRQFLRRQGPCCEGLVQALRDEPGAFDAIVFFTALYHPTAEGIPAWGWRSVLIPTLHDEKAMYLPWFHRTFAGAGITLWNTAAEQRLAGRLYGASAAEGHVVGAGVQVQVPTADAVAEARRRFKLPSKYLVYVGRIEKGKGCADLLAAWQDITRDTADAALVFIGKGAMEVPTSARVRLSGWLEVADRDALVAGAAALVMPSRHESLSLVLLEAFALGVPALANGDCGPLADHVAISGAGECYRGGRELRAGLLRALARPDDERQRLGEAGRAYVAAHYAQNLVTQAWLDAVEAACTAPEHP